MIFEKYTSYQENENILAVTARSSNLSSLSRTQRPKKYQECIGKQTKDPLYRLLQKRVPVESLTNDPCRPT
jgi:hypothetical protein